MNPLMKIDCVVSDDFQVNTYVLRCRDQAGPCVVIDPGLGPEKLVDLLRSGSMDPAAVILTHGHVDHIAGVREIGKAFPHTRLYVHRLDAPMLSDPRANLSALFSVPCEIGRPDVLVEDGQIIEEADLRLQVIHTPGHTPGGISLYCRADGVVFTGDALFAGSVGRTDFPGGDHEQLITAIDQKLMALPEETQVLPGHGPGTTIGWERGHNPFLKRSRSTH